MVYAAFPRFTAAAPVNPTLQLTICAMVIDLLWVGNVYLAITTLLQQHGSSMPMHTMGITKQLILYVISFTLLLYR